VPLCNGKVVQVQAENMMAVIYLKEGGGTYLQAPHQQMSTNFCLCTSNNISSTRGCLNVVAGNPIFESVRYQEDLLMPNHGRRTHPDLPLLCKWLSADLP
jgi:hypothetical protein